MKDKKHTKQSAGQKGGLATLARYGPDHMRAIDKRGAAQFAITKRDTNEVIAFTSGRFGR